jgi:hypothetical protein
MREDLPVGVMSHCDDTCRRCDGSSSDACSFGNSGCCWLVAPSNRKGSMVVCSCENCPGVILCWECAGAEAVGGAVGSSSSPLPHVVRPGGVAAAQGPTHGISRSARRTSALLYQGAVLFPGHLLVIGHSSVIGRLSVVGHPSVIILPQHDNDRWGFGMRHNPDTKPDDCSRM